MIDISAIDEQLSQQGRFCLIDWLLADNFLHYADYEAWRYGNLKSLDMAIRLDPEKLQLVIDDTAKHCFGLGLTSQSQDFFSWNGDCRELLIVSEDDQQTLALAQHWISPGDRMQPDLFQDNSAQIAENALLEAFSSRHFGVAQSRLQKLFELNPDCTRLGVYQDLVNYVQHMLSNPKITEPALDAELEGLEQEVLPLVQEVLGPAAKDFLAYAWRRLSKAMLGMPYDPPRPNRHASSVLLRIPDFQAVIACLDAEPELYRQTVLLERKAQSHSALHQHETGLMLWCLLMELDADYTEQALDRHPSHRIYTLWQDFWDTENNWSSTNFPAYVLLRHPGLLDYLQNLPPLRLPSSQAMVLLLRQRLAGDDEIPARKELQSISPELLSAYLKSL